MVPGLPVFQGIMEASLTVGIRFQLRISRHPCRMSFLGNQEHSLLHLDGARPLARSLDPWKAYDRHSEPLPCEMERAEQLKAVSSVSASPVQA